jgi:hypothetical protein
MTKSGEALYHRKGKRMSLDDRSTAGLSKAFKKAKWLQDANISSEAGKGELFPDYYSPIAARVATVHSRQDIVLIVSLLDSAVTQLRWIKYICASGVLLLLIAAFLR